MPIRALGGSTELHEGLPARVLEPGSDADRDLEGGEDINVLNPDLVLVLVLVLVFDAVAAGVDRREVLLVPLRLPVANTGAVPLLVRLPPLPLLLVVTVTVVVVVEVAPLLLLLVMLPLPTKPDGRLLLLCELESERE